jgi:hypothetical protein
MLCNDNRAKRRNIACIRSVALLVASAEKLAIVAREATGFCRQSAERVSYGGLLIAPIQTQWEDPISHGWSEGSRNPEKRGR